MIEAARCSRADRTFQFQRLKIRRLTVLSCVKLKFIDQRIFKLQNGNMFGQVTETDSILTMNTLYQIIFFKALINLKSTSQQ